MESNRNQVSRRRSSFISLYILLSLILVIGLAILYSVPEDVNEWLGSRQILAILRPELSDPDGQEASAAPAMSAAQKTSSLPGGSGSSFASAAGASQDEGTGNPPSGNGDGADEGRSPSKSGESADSSSSEKDKKNKKTGSAEDDDSSSTNTGKSKKANSAADDGSASKAAGASKKTNSAADSGSSSKNAEKDKKSGSASDDDSSSKAAGKSKKTNSAADSGSSSKNSEKGKKSGSASDDDSSSKAAGKSKKTNSAADSGSSSKNAEKSKKSGSEADSDSSSRDTEKGKKSDRADKGDKDEEDKLLSVADFSVPAADREVPSEDSLTSNQKELIRQWEETHLRTFPLNSPLHDYDWKYLSRGEDGRLRYEGDENYTIRHGVDVSLFQGSIDWKKVKADGFDFAFIRVGNRLFDSGLLQQDERAVKNLRRARAAGLDVGVYVFSQAIITEEAVEEAQLCLDIIEKSGVDVTLPIVFDPEVQADYPYARINYISSEQFTENALAFCRTVEEAGFAPSIYANSSTQTDILDMARIHEVGATIWYADYNTTPECPYQFTFLQYSETGQVDGIGGNTDLNVWFVKK